MATTWIMVAERSRARVFTLANRMAPLEELEDMVHPQSRFKESELVSDHAGKMPDKGQPGVHAAPSATAAKEKEAEAFAQWLCQWLEQAFAEHRLTRLAIIAPPDFLGLLRQRMSVSLRASVVAEVAKNLATASAEQIREHLPGSLVQC